MPHLFLALVVAVNNAPSSVGGGGSSFSLWHLRLCSLRFQLPEPFCASLVIPFRLLECSSMASSASAPTPHPHFSLSDAQPPPGCPMHKKGVNNVAEPPDQPDQPLKIPTHVQGRPCEAAKVEVVQSEDPLDIIPASSIPGWHGILEFPPFFSFVKLLRSIRCMHTYKICTLHIYIYIYICVCVYIYV